VKDRRGESPTSRKAKVDTVRSMRKVNSRSRAQPERRTDRDRRWWALCEVKMDRRKVSIDLRTHAARDRARAATKVVARARERAPALSKQRGAARFSDATSSEPTQTRRRSKRGARAGNGDCVVVHTERTGVAIHKIDHERSVRPSETSVRAAQKVCEARIVRTRGHARSSKDDHVWRNRERKGEHPGSR